MAGLADVCPAGPCQAVAFKREIPRDDFFRSTLHRRGPGVYEGREFAKRVVCAPDPGHGKRTAWHTVKVIAEEDGQRRRRFEVMPGIGSPAAAAARLANGRRSMARSANRSWG